MSETKKTLTYCSVAISLLLVAFLMTPRKVTPDVFLDREEAFFPEFTDPNSATTLEVVEYDEETGTARPFKVTFKAGQWSIPSHHDYPADGKDRLARTAAGVIGIKKDDFRTNSISDHGACGVIDPLDETITILKGRGKRVTIKAENDRVLADLIVGKKVEGQDNLRFVRIPGKKRVYVSRMDINISTRFEDWIERDLLELEKDDVEKIVLRDYSINERTRRVDQRDVVTLDQKEDDGWKANRMSGRQEVDSIKMNGLLRAIDELSIVGVRPKPAGLSHTLQKSEGGVVISPAAVRSLQSKGYYFTRDGSLLSNEGELQIQTSARITYTLRFGEIVYGTGEVVTAGTEAGGARDSSPGENRYLLVTVSFDPKLFREPSQPRKTDFLNKPEGDWTDVDRRDKELKDKHDEWEAKIRKGREFSDRLNARFAGWYYVISSDSFDKIHMKRADLVKQKES